MQEDQPSEPVIKENCDLLSNFTKIKFSGGRLLKTPKKKRGRKKRKGPKPKPVVEVSLSPPKKRGRPPKPKKRKYKKSKNWKRGGKPKQYQGETAIIAHVVEAEVKKKAQEIFPQNLSKLVNAFLAEAVKGNKLIIMERTDI